MLTIPTDQPWVPLRILSLGLPKTQTVDADVFLLTDKKPDLLSGGTGLDLRRSEPANTSLLADLRSDKGMEWMPQSMWFTYLEVNARAADLDYDLAVSTDAKVAPARLDTGIPRPVTVDDDGLARWPIFLGGITAAVAIFFLAAWAAGGRRRTS
jgi:hypothetical protein